MNRGRILKIGIPVLCLLLALFVSLPGILHGISGSKSSKTPSKADGGDVVDASGAHRTKVGERPAPQPKPTHFPEALPSFYLPSLHLEDLLLSEALDLVLKQYSATCERAGEVPLRIRFLNVSDDGRRINLNLQTVSLDQAVRLLAAFSGLEVRRTGVTYKFLEFTGDDSGLAGQPDHINPSIEADLAEILGTKEGTLQEIFSSSGLLKDPNTSVSIGSDGTLIIDGGDPADRALISNLLTTASARTSIQQKVTSKIVNLPDGFDLGIPSGSILSDPELQILMRKLAMTQGTNFLTMPSVTMRPGEDGTIKMIREAIVPDPDAPNKFTTFEIGKTMNTHTSPLGLGHELKFRYEDSKLAETPGQNPSKHRIVNSEGRGYQSNDGTRVTISRRDDGGYTATFVNAVLVDQTGRPVSQETFRGR